MGCFYHGLAAEGEAKVADSYHTWPVTRKTWMRRPWMSVELQLHPCRLLPWDLVFVTVRPPIESP
jgi:hypothetical protein